MNPLIVQSIGVFVSPEFPERGDISARGLKLEDEIPHPETGTAWQRLPLGTGGIEFIWIQDRVKAIMESHKFHLRAYSEKTGFIPFAIFLKGEIPGVAADFYECKPYGCHIFKPSQSEPEGPLIAISHGGNASELEQPYGMGMIQKVTITTPEPEKAQLPFAVEGLSFDKGDNVAVEVTAKADKVFDVPLTQRVRFRGAQ